MQSKSNLKEKDIDALGIDVALRISKGQKINDLLGVSDTSMSYLYESARYEYNSAKYSNALRVFSFLLTFDGNNNLYRFGYAASMQALKMYQPAIEFYAEIGKTEPENTEIDIQIAKCFLALGNKKMAKTALENARTFAKNNPDLLSRIHSIKEQVENE